MKDQLEAFLCDYKLLCLKHFLCVGWDYSTLCIEQVDMTGEDEWLNRSIEQMRKSGDAFIQQQLEKEQAIVRQMQEREALHKSRVVLLRQLIAEGKEVPDHLLTDRLIEVKRKLLTGEEVEV